MKNCYLILIVVLMFIFLTTGCHSIGSNTSTPEQIESHDEKPWNAPDSWEYLLPGIPQ